MLITAGDKHGLAVCTDRTLYAWGDNTYGQCDVPQMSGPVVAIGGAIGFSIAIVDVVIPAENIAPVADAGDDIIAHANDEIVLDASASYDADGTIVMYTWKRLPDDVVLYSGPDPTTITHALGRVEEVIELTVSDDLGLFSSDTVIIFNALVSELLEN